MKPRHPPPCEKFIGYEQRAMRPACLRASLALLSLVLLTACEQNTFVPPPPPKVDVGVPVQRTITRYLEATGNTAPVKTVDLVARVQGFLQSINYQDGTFVKEGTTLFTIEPETYKPNLLQAQVNTRIAQVNYGYTNVIAPFDGIVSAHLVSVGELVGVASPTQLATIVALDPIYVNFNVNEQDVLRIRAEAARKGMTAADLKQLPIEVGLQTETGYPHTGKLDYAAPTVNQSTGTLPVRGVLPNANRVLLPGYFVRVRVPIDEQSNALLVPDVALGSDQGGRYLLVVTGENVVEQRKVQTGPLDGELRIIESGLKPDDRVVIAGLLRAIPGQKVDPQLQKIEPPPASAK